jgi:hypothetical protein
MSSSLSATGEKMKTNMENNGDANNNKPYYIIALNKSFCLFSFRLGSLVVLFSCDGEFSGKTKKDGISDTPNPRSTAADASLILMRYWNISFDLL